MRLAPSLSIYSSLRLPSQTELSRAPFQQSFTFPSKPTFGHNSNPLWINLGRLALLMLFTYKSCATYQNYQQQQALNQAESSLITQKLDSERQAISNLLTDWRKQNKGNNGTVLTLNSFLLQPKNKDLINSFTMGGWRLMQDSIAQITSPQAAVQLMSDISKPPDNF